MKIENYQFPKSSFLSVDKDLNLIVTSILKNKRLLKLLHYTTPDSLDRPDLTQDEKIALINKNIRIVPKLEIEGEVKNYIIISFDDFVENNSNPEFRDNVIEFDIICHFDSWHLKDFELRPYRILAEIDTMFNNKHLTGIGELEFLGASRLILNDEYAGFCAKYIAIHGGEDKYKMPNPIDEEAFIKDFNELFNNE